MEEEKKIKRITSILSRYNAYNELLYQYLLSEDEYSNGYIVASIVYGEDGGIEKKSLFELDDFGSILVQTQYERSNDLIERTEFFDTEEGSQYKTEITTADGLKTIHEYRYDQLGNTDQVIVKNEAGEVEAYEIFKYNEQGILEEEFRLDENRKIQFSRKVEYDVDGRISNERYFDQNNNLQRNVEYQYNTFGLLTEKIDTNHEWGNVTKSKYTYDLHSNQVLDETSENGMVIFKNHCKYNEFNNLIEERIIQIGTENFIEVIDYEIEYEPD